MLRLLVSLTLWGICMSMSYEDFDLVKFLRELKSSQDTKPREFLSQILDAGLEFTESYLKEHPEATPSEYPYFNFYPMWRASIIPNSGVEMSWSGECFKQNSGFASIIDNSTVLLKITSSNPVSEECYDHYRIMTVAGMKFLRIPSTGSVELEFSASDELSEAERWDLQTKGLRVMEVVTDIPTTIANYHETIKLMRPMMYDHVDKSSAERNTFFMENYAHFPMTERDPLNRLPPLESEIHSGDLFGIIRLDGLDPLVAYFMGSTTGHNTMALWMDGELFVVESTVESVYWPTDGIQKTPYRQWIRQAQDAGFNVVHAPLSKKSRMKWNETAAVELFRELEGFEYGYINMMWAAVDTLYDSYPCIPGDFSSVCLQFELVETLFAMIDKAAPDISDLFWNLAWNKRIGTDGLNTVDIYYEGFKKGIDSRAIPMMVEKDSWNYNTTKYGEPAEGPAIMCCVLVCRLWQAAGLFDDLEVNCGELTDLDVYTLDVLDSNYTQIMGRYTLELNKYNSKTPYAHMGETCAAMAPDYEQEPDC